MKSYTVLVGIFCVIAMLMAGCGGSGGGGGGGTPPPSPPAKQYAVSYSIAPDGWLPELRVTVKGPSKNLNIILSDPDKNTIGTAFITEDDLLDGTESVNVDMAGDEETPKAGIYTLIVKDSWSDEIYYQDTITFSGAEIYITNVYIESEYYELFNEYHITENISVTNGGDLPAYLVHVVTYLDGEEIPAYIFGSGRVDPGESKTIGAESYTAEVSSGTHTLRIEFPQDEAGEPASYTAQITL